MTDLIVDINEARGMRERKAALEEEALEVDFMAEKHERYLAISREAGVKGEEMMVNIEEGRVRIMGPPTDTEIAVRREYLWEMIAFLEEKVEGSRMELNNLIVEQGRRRRDALDMERIKKEVHDDACHQIPDDDGC